MNIVSGDRNEHSTNGKGFGTGINIGMARYEYRMVLWDSEGINVFLP
jgi:hypothetical protein